MKQDIVILDLFSGIGGFSKGFQDAGFNITKHYFSDVDKHAIANYKYNFKNAEYVGSVTNVRGKSIERPNVITFGSPCQDFSLAGKRKGMDGKRSSLILEAIRLVDECRPDVFIWENVKGAFSSNNGADFWAIIQAFTNIGGYRLEWQLLNTAWFLPQNRERIYLIGHLAGSSRPGVFPFAENDSTFESSQESKVGRFQTENSTTIGTKTGSRATDTFVNVPLKAGTLTGGGNSGGLHSDMTTIEVGTIRTHKDGQGFRNVKSDKSPCLAARARTDGSGQGAVKIHKTQPRSGDPSKGGTGLLSNESKAYCLDRGQTNAIELDTQIRRFTEIECERLQGFPDDWTKFGLYEKQVWINKKEKTFKIVESVHEIPKTQRYKLLGNAVTSLVVKKIALKLRS